MKAKHLFMFFMTVGSVGVAGLTLGIVAESSYISHIGGKVAIAGLCGMLVTTVVTIIFDLDMG